MSAAVCCDNCGETLVVNDRGEDEDGEIHAWLRVGTRDGALVQDACTRSCAIALLGDDAPLGIAVDARQEGIAEVVRVIREERQRRESDSENEDEA